MVGDVSICALAMSVYEQHWSSYLKSAFNNTKFKFGYEKLSSKISECLTDVLRQSFLKKKKKWIEVQRNNLFSENRLSLKKH